MYATPPFISRPRRGASPGHARARSWGCGLVLSTLLAVAVGCATPVDPWTVPVEPEAGVDRAPTAPRAPRRSLKDDWRGPRRGLIASLRDEALPPVAAAPPRAEPTSPPARDRETCRRGGAVVEAELCRLTRDLRYPPEVWELGPQAAEQLAELSTLMRRRPSLRILAIGHADATGTGTYNRTLSEMRAMRVREYLILSGVDETRVEAQGSGEDWPAEPNAHHAGRALNRRTQLVPMGTAPRFAFDPRR